MSRRHGVAHLVGAQARVGVGLAAALDPPVLGKLARGVAGTPRVEDTEVGGVAATVFRPGRGSGPWPATVAFPGVTREGRRHPAFVGIGRALAAAGRLAVVAEPDGLALGELTNATSEQALAAARATLERPDAAPTGLVLVGVSGGATLALGVAADSSMSDSVRAVAALAPVCDLVEAIRYASTGMHRIGHELVPFETRDFFKLVIARSVIASLPVSTPRSELLARLRALPDYGSDPYRALREWEKEEPDAASRAAVELLTNVDGQRFDDLYAALHPDVRASIESLAVVDGAAAVRAQVELIVARSDKYIPLDDAVAYARACPNARLTVLESIDHAVPRLARDTLRELALLDGALVRTVAASYSR